MAEAPIAGGNLTDRRFPPTNPGLTLEQLCETYWPPVYGFLRKRGNTPEKAKDLAQGFFQHLLDKNRLERIYPPASGKFRTVLLACLKHFCLNDWDKEKNDPVRNTIQMDTEGEETHFDLPGPGDPEAWFDHRWAVAVNEKALDKLEASWSSENDAKVLEALLPVLKGKADRTPNEELARQFGVKHDAARQMVHRLLEDYRAFIRKEILQTVSDPSEIKGEILHFFRALQIPTTLSR